ncbi:MAG: glycosyltransferase [Beijerinckiaceae bacterium]
MGTFVSIGNGTQSFARLLDKVAEIAPSLPQPVIVQHGNTPFAYGSIESFDFVAEARFEQLLAECQLFITHGGGGSVFAALRHGKKPVVAPRLKAFDEIVDDHQIAFVDELARQGLVHPLRDVAELSDVAQKALKDPKLAEKFEGSASAALTIKQAVDDFAPGGGKVLLVTPSGGHLSEIRALRNCYADRPHLYVLNAPIVEPADMQGRTRIIALSQRDWKFLLNLAEAFAIIRRERPAVILTTGGGFSVAFALMGKLFGVKTVYVETVAKVNVPTVTGKIMYRLAERFFYQWPYLEPFFPKGEYVGLIL